MDSQLIEACERFREALEKRDSRNRVSAFAIRKSKTLYLVSSEARELRRLDAIYSEAR